MATQCDHKCVGMLVWKNGKLLLIERKKFPFGFAPPAGHCDEDGDDFEKAAKRELLEEVGLQAQNLELALEARKETPCRRENGTWHYWKIYQIKAEGDIKRSEDETKQVDWYSKDEILQLAQRTEKYMAGGISEEEWQNSPGLEVVWYDWLIKEKLLVIPEI